MKSEIVAAIELNVACKPNCILAISALGSGFAVVTSIRALECGARRCR